MIALQFGSNMLGKLSPEIQERLQAVVDNPCEETWDDTHCIILSGKGRMKTLWNAVLEVDPTYLRSKPCDDPWGEIPTKETIVKAINHVLLGDVCVN